MSWNNSERAAALHADALVWDCHAGFDPDPKADLGQLERWRKSGVDYLSIDVCYDVRPWTNAVLALAAYRAWVMAHPRGYLLAETVADVRRAKVEGKLAVSFDLEGMNALHDEVGMVDVYYRLGVRQMLFAYNLNNSAGGGCHDEDIGLSDFGRRVIAEMNRVGMLVDCSHSAYRTTMEAMEVSRAPVIFSHSNSRRLHDHERNIVDEQIKGCAATGGIVGVTGIGLFLGDDGATVENLVRHIDYMCDMIGARQVGIGLDFAFENEFSISNKSNHRLFWPERQYPEGDIGFLAPESFPAVTEALVNRGYSDDDIRGILGENFLRVAGDVWK